MALTAIAATAVAAEKDFLPYTEVNIAIHTVALTHQCAYLMFSIDRSGYLQNFGRNDIQHRARQLCRER